MSPELKETINRKTIEFFQEYFLTDGLIDKEESLEVIEILIEKLGGWDKLYGDFDSGMKEGFSLEEQFKMLNQMIMGLK
jgi:hypothetical protein